VNEILPAGEHTAEEIDDLFSTVERNGINIHQDITEAAARSRHHDTQGTERGIRAPL
jgi:DNA-binding winged helix-turn-helix (wHTH) protein